MKRTERRDYVIRRVKVNNIDIEDLTDVDMQYVINKLEQDLEFFSNEQKIISTSDLFAYVALSYAISLYKAEHVEKSNQKADIKRLDETIKRIENFFKPS